MNVPPWVRYKNYWLKSLRTLGKISLFTQPFGLLPAFKRRYKGNEKHQSPLEEEIGYIIYRSDAKANYPVANSGISLGNALKRQFSMGEIKVEAGTLNN